MYNYFLHFCNFSCRIVMFNTQIALFKGNFYQKKHYQYFHAHQTNAQNVIL